MSGTGAVYFGYAEGFHRGPFLVSMYWAGTENDERDKGKPIIEKSVYLINAHSVSHKQHGADGTQG